MEVRGHDTGNRTGVVLLNRKLEMVLYLLMYYNHV